MRLLSSTRTRLDRIAGSGLHWLARRSALDATDDLSNQNLLVLAPHPDDETLACGATIARAVAGGKEVAVLVATDGRFGVPGDPDHVVAVRRNELRCATSELGLANADVLRLEIFDGDLAAHHDRLVQAITRLVVERRPSAVLSPSRHDPHPDHRALSGAARKALASSNARLYEYVVWAWLMPSRSIAFQRGGRAEPSARQTLRPRNGRARAVRVGTFLAQKRAALACHRSQLAPDADAVGLPSGSGFLGSAFLKRFLTQDELFFPVARDTL